MHMSRHSALLTSSALAARIWPTGTARPPSLRGRPTTTARAKVIFPEDGFGVSDQHYRRSRLVLSGKRGSVTRDDGKQRKLPQVVVNVPRNSTCHGFTVYSPGVHWSCRKPISCFPVVFSVGIHPERIAPLAKYKDTTNPQGRRVLTRKHARCQPPKQFQAS